ncbi:hypothetical protein MHYP_G00200030 [Metynnis hypsauchen]
MCPLNSVLQALLIICLYRKLLVWKFSQNCKCAVDVNAQRGSVSVKSPAPSIRRMLTSTQQMVVHARLHGFPPCRPALSSARSPPLLMHLLLFPNGSGTKTMTY